MNAEQKIAELMFANLPQVPQYLSHDSPSHLYSAFYLISGHSQSLILDFPISALGKIRQSRVSIDQDHTVPHSPIL